MLKSIRSVEPRDAAPVSRIYAPFVTDSATSFEAVPPDVFAIEQRILETADHYPWLVFEVDGEVLGYAYASSHRTRPAYQWCVEVSVYVDGRAQKRGVGRALYSALFELLRRQGYVNAYAGITVPNPSSMALHESLGFVHIAIFPRIGFKLGQWHDVAWLQLRLRDDPVPIETLLPARPLIEDRRVLELLQRFAETVRLG